MRCKNIVVSLALCLLAFTVSAANIDTVKTVTETMSQEDKEKSTEEESEPHSKEGSGYWKNFFNSWNNDASRSIKRKITSEIAHKKFCVSPGLVSLFIPNWQFAGQIADEVTNAKVCIQRVSVTDNLGKKRGCSRLFSQLNQDQRTLWSNCKN